MKYSAEVLSDEKLLHLFSIEEDHFNDFKAKDISGKNFSKILCFNPVIKTLYQLYKPTVAETIKY